MLVAQLKDRAKLTRLVSGQYFFLKHLRPGPDQHLHSCMACLSPRRPSTLAAVHADLSQGWSAKCITGEEGTCTHSTVCRSRDVLSMEIWYKLSWSLFLPTAGVTEEALKLTSIITNFRSVLQCIPRSPDIQKRFHGLGQRSITMTPQTATAQRHGSPFSRVCQFMKIQSWDKRRKQLLALPLPPA